MMKELVAGLALAVAGTEVLAESSKRVAMVFDDGPSKELAAQLIALLEEEEVVVSFAQVANLVEKHPDLTRLALEKGHEIVNHSYDHRNVDELTDQELEHEIVGAQRKMESLLSEPPKWYWPPYLKTNDRIRKYVKLAGITLYEPAKVVVSMDYDRSVGAEEIYEKAIAGVEDGSVILFHEWREETVEKLPEILASLREQDCVFLTFSELHDARRRK